MALLRKRQLKEKVKGKRAKVKGERIKVTKLGS